jgi:hypothetical protein
VLVLKLVLQLLAVAVAVLGNNLDYIWSDRRTKIFKRGRIALYAVSAIFLMISGVVTVQDERAKEREADALRTQLEALRTAAADAAHNMKERDAQQTKHENELKGQMAELLAGNHDLKKRLEPFETLLRQRYPGTAPEEGLQRLREDLQSLGKRTEDLESKTRDRELSVDARSKMIAALSPFKGTKVEFSVSASDPEATIS